MERNLVVDYYKEALITEQIYSVVVGDEYVECVERVKW